MLSFFFFLPFRQGFEDTFSSKGELCHVGGRTIIDDGAFITPYPVQQSLVPLLSSRRCNFPKHRTTMVCMYV